MDTILIYDEHKNKIGGKSSPDLAEIIYYVFRCCIHHGEDIPQKFKFSPSNNFFRIIMSEINGNALNLPQHIIWGLIDAAVFCKSNINIKSNNAFFLSYDSSDIEYSQVEVLENKTIRFSCVMKKGEITQFFINDSWGKEEKVRELLAKYLPKKIVDHFFIPLEAMEYNVQYEITYVDGCR